MFYDDETATIRKYTREEFIFQFLKLVILSQKIIHSLVNASLLAAGPHRTDFCGRFACEPCEGER